MTIMMNISKGFNGRDLHHEIENIFVTKSEAGYKNLNLTLTKFPSISFYSKLSPSLECPYNNGDNESKNKLDCLDTDSCPASSADFDEKPEAGADVTSSRASSAKRRRSHSFVRLQSFSAGQWLVVLALYYRLLLLTFNCLTIILI